MAKYRIVLTVDANRIDHLKKQVLALGLGVPAQVEKLIRDQDKSRSDRLTDAEGSVADARHIVEELKDEMTEWLENMPESLRDGDKASDIQEAIDGLERIESSLDEIDFNDVSFPAMM